MPDIDIIIPLYRSKANIGPLVARLNEWTVSVDLSVNVIFVDDGGTDGTFELLQQELQHASFEFLSLKLIKNYGQHTATATGFSQSTAKWVATIDDDLQHDPFELNQMLSVLQNENADLVYGIYDKKKHSAVRNLGSFLLKKIFWSEGRDYSAVTSFRLMKSSVITTFKNAAIPVIFIDEYLVENSYIQSFCSVSHSERNEGKSSYSNWKLLKMATGILLFHSSWPLKIITRFGMMMSLVFFVFGCYFIWQKMANDVQLGFTSIIVALFFSTGLILLSLGIIGEYIRRIWIAQHKLDRVIIAEKC